MTRGRIPSPDRRALRYRNTKLKSNVTVPGTMALGAAGGLPLAS
jgi:hypothetical protein